MQPRQHLQTLAKVLIKNLENMLILKTLPTTQGHIQDTPQLKLHCGYTEWMHNNGLSLVPNLGELQSYSAMAATGLTVTKDVQPV